MYSRTLTITKSLVHSRKINYERSNCSCPSTYSIGSSINLNPQQQKQPLKDHPEIKQQPHFQKVASDFRNGRSIQRVYSTNVSHSTPATDLTTKILRQDSFSSSIHVPIAIVGGGPTGLLLANLFQFYQIPFILLETQPANFSHPQAHFLNTRTMEILKHFFSSSIFKKLQTQIRPVQEWNTFWFGSSCYCPTTNKDDSTTNASINHSSLPTTTTLAYVVHPVDVPIYTNQNANGRLLDTSSNSNTTSSNDSQPTSFPLSDCSVGHLPQHTFSQILYESAVASIQENESSKTYQSSSTTGEKQSSPSSSTSNSMLKDSSGLESAKLLFNSKVHKVMYDDNATCTDHDSSSANYPWRLETTTTATNDSGAKDDSLLSTTKDQTIHAKIVIAADGANSMLRNQFFDADFSQRGIPNIQQLINVHFTILNDTTTPIIPPSMLYTILHPKLIAMMVRHDAREYVLQIPYFPPYQTMEEDFSHEKVSDMIRTVILGEANSNNSDIAAKENDKSFVIQSIRPWTMGSLVAKNYYVPSPTQHGLFLVGDAAHVFPPAGGFGMNTGLQDAINLAWRISLWWNRHRQSEENSDCTSDGTCPSNDDDRIARDTTQSDRTLLDEIGRLYDQERQPVAKENAALSVRNYQRVKHVFESFYLHNQHPTLLKNILSAMPAASMSLKRSIFRSLLQTALWPLSQLIPSNTDNTSITLRNNPYAQHVTENLRTMLRSGQGLPLLFPKYEIGFGYPGQSEETNTARSTTNTVPNDDNTSWETDTIAPALAPFQVGYLFPHFVADIIGTDDGDTWNLLLEKYPNLCILEDDNAIKSKSDNLPSLTKRNYITTRDLPVQLSTETQPLTFVLLHIKLLDGVSGDTTTKDYSNFCDEACKELATVLSDESSIPLRLATLELVKGSSDMVRKTENDRSDTLSLRVPANSTWNAYVLEVLQQHQDWNHTTSSLAVLIRPDGHIASIVPQTKEHVTCHHMMLNDIRRCLGYDPGSLA